MEGWRQIHIPRQGQEPFFEALVIAFAGTTSYILLTNFGILVDKRLLARDAEGVLSSP